MWIGLAQILIKRPKYIKLKKMPFWVNAENADSEKSYWLLASFHSQQPPILTGQLCAHQINHDTNTHWTTSLCGVLLHSHYGLLKNISKGTSSGAMRNVSFKNFDQRKIDLQFYNSSRSPFSRCTVGSILNGNIYPMAPIELSSPIR